MLAFGAVWISDLLKSQDPQLRADLHATICARGISLREIPGTRDIWCRDFMPVPLRGRRFVQFSYSPRYLASRPELITPPEVAIRLVGTCKRSELVIDGGNIVKCDRVAIVTDRIFEENPSLSRTRLTSLLRDELEIDRLVLVPAEQGDIFGHADGLVHLLDEHAALVSDCSKIDRHYSRTLARALRSGGVEPVPVPYAPVLSRRAVPPATGVYVNVLRTSAIVVVPIYQLPSDEKAVTAIERVLRGVPLMTVDCSRVARNGGSLGCITWTAG